MTFGGFLAAASSPIAHTTAADDTTRSVQKALERLPYYGVFDFLAFSVDRGCVTLVGYVYRDHLKSAAEEEVKRARGVDEVSNGLEVLPASLHDDRIRRATFARIYLDNVLSRYAPGGEGQVRYDVFNLWRYPGMQPVGSFPIHIIVKNGQTTLMGAVGSDADKQIAGMRAREIGGVFSVENKLVVEKQ
jgi:osmotically-inducible protein OsmY